MAESKDLSIDEKLDIIIAFIEDIRPVIEQVKDKAPELLEQVGPMLEKVSKNPMLKMLGL